jgi:hypothetical protein
MRGDRHDHGLGRHRLGAAAVGALTTVMLAAAAGAVVPTPVPPAQRGSIDAERSGFHDAANLRTVFWNFGMVGDYPLDPLRVDLTTFHSAEAPKGSGMNYSDGITPFVLAKVQTTDGQTRYIMETGYRERQELSPFTSKIMRFEPRPGYFEPTPGINVARSPAISSDTRTWPGSWPDRLDDPDDPAPGTATSASVPPPTRRASRSWTTSSTTHGSTSPTRGTRPARGWACASRCAASSGPTRRPGT